MKRSEFRKLIKECLQEVLLENWDINTVVKMAGKIIEKQVSGSDYPSFDNFQSVIRNRVLMDNLKKYPMEKAAYVVADKVIQASKNP